MPIPLVDPEPEDPGQPDAAPAAPAVFDRLRARARAPRTAPALRRAIIETLRRIGPDGPIFFDGSAYALATLGGALALGGKTWLTAARLDEQATDTPVARVAREVAGQLGLPYRSATIPRRTSQVFADLRDILRAAPDVAVADLPVVQAVLHAARAARAGGATRLLGGLSGAPQAALAVAARAGVQVVDAVRDADIGQPAAAAVLRAFPELARVRSLLDISDVVDPHAELARWHAELRSSRYGAPLARGTAGFFEDMRAAVLAERQGDLEVRPAPSGGLGVFVTRPIRAGSLVMSYWYTGPFLRYDEQLDPDLEWLTIQFSAEHYILCDVAEPHRYVNHACTPSCVIQNGLDLHAARDLVPGDEITFDYSTTMGPRETWTHVCRCGVDACRGTIGNFVSLPEAVQSSYRARGAVGPHCAR